MATSGKLEHDQSSNPIRAYSESILDDYLRIRREDAMGGHRLHAETREIKTRFEVSEVVARNRNLKIRPSLGQGRWAETPSIAFLDRRETDTAQNGMFVIYRFLPDETAMHLILGQGVVDGGVDARRSRRQHVEACRGKVGDLRSLGFELAGIKNLRLKPRDAEQYGETVIAHKRYTRGQIPEDAILLDDLKTLLMAYERCLGFA